VVFSFKFSAKTLYVFVNKDKMHLFESDFECGLLLQCSIRDTYDDIRNVRYSEISGSHGGEYEDDCLLGCCAV
jgi:hypothetical protein